LILEKRSPVSVAVETGSGLGPIIGFCEQEQEEYLDKLSENEERPCTMELAISTGVVMYQ
jgi:hypothetical protein